MGILSPSDINEVGTSVKSIQAIDLKKKNVRNVVTFQTKNMLPPLPFLPQKNGYVRGSITVDVAFSPDKEDDRRVNVKFQSCRVSLQNSKLDATFPLGLIGPTGWLKTMYIDESMRITRGHKGSVFVLIRTNKA